METTKTTGTVRDIDGVAWSGVTKKLAKAASRRLEQLLGEIEAKKARIVLDFYDIGVALREIRDRKLYAVAGCKTFHELLERRDVMGRTQAGKLITIVENVSREQAVSEGIERSYALFRLTAATREEDSPANVERKGVLLRGKKTAVKGLSGRKVAALARRVRHASAKPDPQGAEARREIDAAEKAMRARRLDVAIGMKMRRGEPRAVLEMPLETLAVIVRAVRRTIK